MSTTVDMISHPPHYQGSKWESIEIIEALGNQFRLGNALKYIFRHAKKNGVEDLRKCRWYLEREFAQAKPACPRRFDPAFWHKHADEFASSFGIEDPDLCKAVAAINMACFQAWQESDARWRKSIIEAMRHLNAYLLRLEPSGASPAAEADEWCGDARLIMGE